MPRQANYHLATVSAKAVKLKYTVGLILNFRQNHALIIIGEIFFLMSINLFTKTSFVSNIEHERSNDIRIQ